MRGLLALFLLCYPLWAAGPDVIVDGIGEPFGVEIGPDGALYVTEITQHRILRVDLTTRKASVAASGNISEPYEVRFDRSGRMYFVEMVGQVIRRTSGAGLELELLAGSPGERGFAGDGGPASRALLRSPHSIALDETEGNLYVADIGNHRIRRIDLASGRIETIAGTGEKKLPEDGTKAAGRAILGPRALSIQGRTLWIALREGNSVWRMDLDSGVLRHVAGTGEKGYSGDGSNPKLATFNGPKGIAAGPDGRVYVVDTENHVLRVIDPRAGRIDSLGKDAGMDRPHGVCVGADGTVYVGDTNRGRVVAFPTR